MKINLTKKELKILYKYFRDVGWHGVEDDMLFPYGFETEEQVIQLQQKLLMNMQKKQNIPFSRREIKAMLLMCDYESEIPETITYKLKFMKNEFVDETKLLSYPEMLILQTLGRQEEKKGNFGQRIFEKSEIYELLPDMRSQSILFLLRKLKETGKLELVKNKGYRLIVKGEEDENTKD
tara:strand:+ start:64 stop:600 length:537 start_codon:yes stop_codon:yes gene_type:complete